ncbi:MAG: hypothetical protein ACRC5M_03895 [Anaeroplasmataceae bacterium]
MGIKTLWDFYSSLTANYISGGGLVNRENLSSLSIKPLFDRIVTKTYIKKVICINRFPLDYEYSLVGVLNSIVFTTSPVSKIYTNSYSMSTEVPINSDQFRRFMSSSEESYQSYKSYYESLSGTDQAVGKKIHLGGLSSMRVTKQGLKKLEQEYLSYSYVYEVASNGGKMSNTFFFLEIMSPDNDEMTKVLTEIREYLNTNEFSYSELAANSSNYMSNYSPGSFIRDVNSKEFTSLLLSDENISHTIPYMSPGFIGDGSGELLGIDMQSKSPFILNFFESGARQICLLSAPAGYGKTILAFQTALSFLCSNKHVSVIDIKGDEWVKLGQFTEHVVIDISETSRAYVNTMRLDDIKLEDPNESQEFYTMAVTATVELIKIITDPTSEESRTCETMARQAVEKVFLNIGVQPRAPKTFKYTRVLKYSKIIDTLETLKTSPSYRQYIDLIDKMKVRLSDKFKQSNVFKGKEISIRDVMESQLVIYSLNKNKNSLQTIDDTIRTFMISYLDMKKISIRKGQKLGTVCFYEEMQRKEEFASLMKFIGGVVTGARSSNVVVFLLCNSVRTLLSEDMSLISSNISNFFLGPVVDEEDYKAYSRLGCSELIPKIKELSDEEEKFANQFVVKYNTGVHSGVTSVKCELPKAYMDALKTREVGI